LLIESDPDPSHRVHRVIDLFDIGVPTRAMKELEAEYKKHKDDLFAQIAAEPTP